MVCSLLKTILHIDGVVQERRNSSALAMELRFSRSNPTIHIDHAFVDDQWHCVVQWNLSVTTTSMIKYISCDLFNIVL